jgi:hypothetical protein
MNPTVKTTLGKGCDKNAINFERKNSPFEPSKRFEGVQLTTINEVETSTS